MSDVLRHVHCVRVVRTVLCNFSVVGHDEWEALAINDMPVERVELVSFGQPKEVIYDTQQ